MLLATALRSYTLCPPGQGVLPVPCPRTGVQLHNSFHLHLLLGQVWELLAEQTAVAGTKACALVDLEEDAGVPMKGDQEVVD